MPRQKGVSQVELLRRKQTEIADQLKAAEAKQRDRERQIDNRRRELLGTVVAEYLKQSPDSSLAKTLFELVSQKLTRPADRALFPDLPAIPPAETTCETPPAVDDTTQSGG